MNQLAGEVLEQQVYLPFQRLRRLEPPRASRCFRLSCRHGRSRCRMGVRVLEARTILITPLSGAIVNVDLCANDCRRVTAVTMALAMTPNPSTVAIGTDVV